MRDIAVAPYRPTPLQSPFPLPSAPPSQPPSPLPSLPAHSAFAALRLAHPQGGIFFQEFNRLHIVHEAALTRTLFGSAAGAVTWALYSLGVLSVLCGLCLIAVASAELQRDLANEENGEEEDEGDGGGGGGGGSGGKVDALTSTPDASTSAGSSPASSNASPPSVLIPSESEREEATASRLERSEPPPSTGTSQRRQSTGTPKSVHRRQSTSTTPAGAMPTPGALRARAHRLSISGHWDLQHTPTPMRPSPRGSPMTADLTMRVERSKKFLFAEPIAEPSPAYDAGRAATLGRARSSSSVGSPHTCPRQGHQRAATHHATHAARAATPPTAKKTVRSASVPYVV